MQNKTMGVQFAEFCLTASLHQLAEGQYTLLNTSVTFHLLTGCLSIDLLGVFFLAVVHSKLSNFLYTVVVTNPFHFHEKRDNFGIPLWKLTRGHYSRRTDISKIDFGEEKTSILGEKQGVANKAGLFLHLDIAFLVISKAQKSMDNPTNISVVESVFPLWGIKWRDFLLENEWCND